MRSNWFSSTQNWSPSYDFKLLFFTFDVFRNNFRVGLQSTTALIEYPKRVTKSSVFTTKQFQKYLSNLRMPYKHIWHLF